MFWVEYLFRNPILKSLMTLASQSLDWQSQFMMRETLLDLSLANKGKRKIKFLCNFFYSWIIIIPPLYLPTGSEKSLDLCALILSATDMFILFHKKRVIGNSLFFEPLACQWTKLLISSGQDKYLIPLRGKPTQRVDRCIIRLFFSGWWIWSSHRESSIHIKNVCHSYLILGNTIRDFFFSGSASVSSGAQAFGSSE